MTDFRQNEMTRKITVKRMTIDKMTNSKWLLTKLTFMHSKWLLTINTYKMSIPVITAGKMTEAKMTADKMTLGKMNVVEMTVWNGSTNIIWFTKSLYKK